MSRWTYDAGPHPQEAQAEALQRIADNLERIAVQLEESDQL